MNRKLAVAAGAVLASALVSYAQAQPQGYYRGYGDYGYRYDPPRAYGPDGRYTAYSYPNGYDGYNTAASVAGALLGAVLDPYSFNNVPHDEYGPDPNGMIGPDGRRIKCKLATRYDGYAGRYVKRRECW